MATRRTTAPPATTAAQVVSAEVDTLEPMVPPAGPPAADTMTGFGPPASEAPPSLLAPGERPGVARRRRWTVLFVVVALLLPIWVVLQAVSSAPKFAIVPGDASPATARIDVTGTPTYKPKADTLFVTVGVPRLSKLGRWLAQREKHDEIVPLEAILGGKTESQNREENLKLMGFSKDFASYVALSKLGYPVKLSGGGAVIADFCLAITSDGKTCTRVSPAASVLKVNDIITAVDGQPVHLSKDVSAVLTGKKVGDQVQVTVKRQKEPAPVTVTVTLTSSGDSSDRAIIGFIPNPSPPADLQFSLPIKVNIDSGQIGGPSAGLAFTLGLLEELTPGELTGGVKVAATGTMSPNGDVGDIGGIRQKTVAVMRAGAKLFLVPADEAKDAQDVAKGSSLQVVGVNTIDEALDQLAKLGGNANDLGQPGKDFTA